MKLEDDPEQTQLVTGIGGGGGVHDYMMRGWQPSFVRLVSSVSTQAALITSYKCIQRSLKFAFWSYHFSTP